MVLVKSVEYKDGVVTLHTYNGNYTNSVCMTDYVIDSGTGRTLNVWTASKGYVSYIYSPDFSLKDTLDYHTVTFDANGGRADYDTKQLTYSASYGLMPIPVREGYVFDGWFTDEKAGDKVTCYSLFNETSDQTLYAHWTLEDMAEDEFAWLGLESIELEKGDSVRLTPGSWSTTDDSVAPVSSNRLFAKRPGTATISGVTERGAVYKVMVTVNAKADEKGEEDQESVAEEVISESAEAGTAAEQISEIGGELVQSAYSSGRYVLTMNELQMYSLEELGIDQSNIRRISRNNVIYVNEDGYVCAVRPGRSVIRARVNGKNIRITVKVTESVDE